MLRLYVVNKYRSLLLNPALRDGTTGPGGNVRLMRKDSSPGLGR